MAVHATYNFAGRTILITGGAGDIGRAAARRFAADGAGVVLLDVNEEKMAKAAGELEMYKTPVAAIRCDVTAPDDVANAFAGAVKRFGASISSSTTRVIRGRSPGPTSTPNPTFNG